MSYLDQIRLLDVDGNPVNPAPSPDYHTSFHPSPDSRTEGISIPFVEADNRLSVRATGYTDEGSFRDCFQGSGIASNLTGTVTVTNGDVVVTGVGTAFISEVNTARYFKISTHSETVFVRVASVDSDTQITLESGYTGASGSGTGQVSFWKTTQTSGATISVGSSLVNLNMPVTSGAVSSIWRDGDYGPFKMTWNFSMNNRRANQDLYIGFADNNNIASANNKVVVKFSGTDNTVVDFITSSGSGNDQSSLSLKLPSISPTTSNSFYEIYVNDTRCVLSVNGIILATHYLVVPGTYDSMGYGMYFVNTGVVAGTTSASANHILFKNFNQIEVTTSAGGDPLTVTSVDNKIATYSAVVRNLAFANNGTCIMSISGSATKVVEITEIEAFFSSTGAAVSTDLSLNKRSTLNTGGTSSAPTKVTYDSNDAPATATVLTYTANPTLGTLVGAIKIKTITVILAGGTPQPFAEEFVSERKKRPTIRGVNELIEINLNSPVVTGTRSADIYIEWIERPIE